MNIWQRLAHSCFGWDYIVFAFGDFHCVERVRRLPNGEFCIYFIDGIHYLRQDGTLTGPDNWVRQYRPLTWRAQEQSSSHLRVVK
jgi:hypothetical protein